MTMEVLQACLPLLNGEYVAIGGGEPTIHPQFWPFLGYILGAEPEGVWLATNGKLRTHARALAGLAGTRAEGILSVALSLDEWHEPIAPEVVDLFKKKKLEIRRVTRDNIVAAGRGAELTTNPGCICEDVIVAPTGDVYTCGCFKGKLGTVFDTNVGEAISDWVYANDGEGCVFVKK